MRGSGERLRGCVGECDCGMARASMVRMRVRVRARMRGKDNKKDELTVRA